MSNLFEKAKEKIQESIVQMFFAAITALLALIAVNVGALVLPVLGSIQNNVLLALLALSLLINVGLWLYASHISKQLRNLQDTNFTKRFGILWDKDYGPHCQACKTLLSSHHTVSGGSRFNCVKCGDHVALPSNKGIPISLVDAVKELNQMQKI